MRARLIFVTYVSLLAIAAVVASQVYQSERFSQSALVHEGNSKLAEAQNVQSELKEKFGIELKSQNVEQSSLEWKTLTKEERREVQGEIAHYLALVNRVFEIDAKHGITIENRTQLIGARDVAETFQKAGENFEQTFGENYEPKRNEPALHTSNDNNDDNQPDEI